MTYHAYLFEVRSIQRFLSATGKLRDMVAASDLIDLVCRKPLDEALRAAGEDPDKVRAMRRAGGAAYLLLSSGERVRTFRNLWRLWLSRHLPGVEVVDAVAEGEDLTLVMNTALEQLRMARNRPQVSHPLATPLSRRTPRTGEAAVDFARESGEPIDASTVAVRRVHRDDGGVAARFLEEDGYLWPDNFEPDAPVHKRFPLVPMEPVALLHADGNGMGELLRKINEAARSLEPDQRIGLYRQFSEGLEACTIAAARKATAEVLLPEANAENVLPARPLVLGGDDLTILVRGDLALPFLEVFAGQFESQSATYLSALSEQAGVPLPEKLTLGAGVVWMKPSHPFLAAHHLAEALCSQSKAAGRRAAGTGIAPSTVAFYRMQSATAEPLSQRLEQESRVDVEGLEVWLNHQAYAICENVPGLPSLTQLEELVTFCENSDLTTSTLRQLVSLLHHTPMQARAAWLRWREVSPKSELRKFDAMMQALLPGERDLHPWLPVTRIGDRLICPLGDVVTMNALRKFRGENSHAA